MLAPAQTARADEHQRLHICQSEGASYLIALKNTKTKWRHAWPRIGYRQQTDKRKKSYLRFGCQSLVPKYTYLRISIPYFATANIISQKTLWDSKSILFLIFSPGFVFEWSTGRKLGSFFILLKNREGRFWSVTCDWWLHHGTQRKSNLPIASLKIHRRYH